jgi:RsmE family RNA methyltransferase
VLSRCVATVASFSVKSLTLINAWRVEKSYFSSKKLRSERLMDDALLGAEQGGHVWSPEIQVVDSFRRYVENIAPGPGSQAARLVLHPGTGMSMTDALHGTTGEGERFLVFGPEGGFIQTELDSWKTHGWAAVDLGTPILRTEAAIAAGLGQLALIQGARIQREPRSPL